MRQVRPGDHVQVHYVIRFEDGTVKSSRNGAPIEIVVGQEHRRLPGMALALVGLRERESTTFRVPAENAYGLRDPSRVRRLDRRCFRPFQKLVVGKWARTANRDRPRLVRILQAHEMEVIVDSNHRWAGQALELELEVIAIGSTDTAINSDNAESQTVTNPAEGAEIASPGTAASVSGQRLSGEPGGIDEGAPGVFCGSG
jgi:FKBP-type peptidyl-prolyl cis-trans isomerase 2